MCICLHNSRAVLQVLFCLYHTYTMLNISVTELSGNAWPMAGIILNAFAVHVAFAVLLSLTSFQGQLV